MTSFADISHHQTSVDLSRYAAAGHDRIVLKATEGVGFTDPAFDGRWRQAGQLGLARVAYCYAEAQDDGARDFDHLLEVVRAAGGTGRGDMLCLDVEDVDDGAKDYSRAQYHVREFTARAFDRGYPRGLIYTGRWYARPAHVDPTDMPPGWRQLWLSHYDQSIPDSQILLPDGWTRDQLVARQYTDRATVAGVSGWCDYSRLLREWIPPKPAPTPQEDDMADPDTLMALDRLGDRIEGAVSSLYSNGFAARAADGTLDPTHEAVSVRGINAELDKILAEVRRTNELLAAQASAVPPAST